MGRNKDSARRRTGEKAPRKTLAIKAARKSATFPRYNFDLSDDSNDSDKGSIDSSVLSTSFDINDLNRDEKIAADAERDRQGRRPLPEPDHKERHQLLQKKIRKFKLKNKWVPSSKSLDIAAEELQEFAHQAREIAKEAEEEEEQTSKNGALPNWIMKALDLTLRMQLRYVESAEKVAEEATLLILKYLNAKEIADNWKPTVDCSCDADDFSEDLSSKEPDCGCSGEYLDNVNGGTKGYLLVAVYQPIVELLNFASTQNSALTAKILQGCFKAIRSILETIERNKNNACASQTLKLLLKFRAEDSNSSNAVSNTVSNRKAEDTGEEEKMQD